MYTYMYYVLIYSIFALYLPNFHSFRIVQPITEKTAFTVLMSNRNPLDDFIRARRRQDQTISQTLDHIQGDNELRRYALWENDTHRRIIKNKAKQALVRKEEAYQQELLEKRRRFCGMILSFLSYKNILYVYLHLIL